MHFDNADVIGFSLLSRTSPAFTATGHFLGIDGRDDAGLVSCKYFIDWKDKHLLFESARRYPRENGPSYTSGCVKVLKRSEFGYKPTSTIPFLASMQGGSLEIVDDGMSR